VVDNRAHRKAAGGGTNFDPSELSPPSRGRDLIDYCVPNLAVMQPRSTLQDDVEQVAMPSEYGELVAACVGVASWLAILILSGPGLAFQTV